MKWKYACGNKLLCYLYYAKLSSHLFAVQEREREREWLYKELC